MITLLSIRAKVDLMFNGLEPEDPTYKELLEVARDLQALDNQQLDQSIADLCTKSPAIGAKGMP